MTCPEQYGVRSTQPCDPGEVWAGWALLDVAVFLVAVAVIAVVVWWFRFRRPPR